MSFEKTFELYGTKTRFKKEWSRVSRCVAQLKKKIHEEKRRLSESHKFTKKLRSLDLLQKQSIHTSMKTISKRLSQQYILLLSSFTLSEA